MDRESKHFALQRDTTDHSPKTVHELFRFTWRAWHSSDKTLYYTWSYGQVVRIEGRNISPYNGPSTITPKTFVTAAVKSYYIRARSVTFQTRGIQIRTILRMNYVFDSSRTTSGRPFRRSCIMHA